MLGEEEAAHLMEKTHLQIMARLRIILQINKLATVTLFKYKFIDIADLNADSPKLQ